MKTIRFEVKEIIYGKFLEEEDWKVVGEKVLLETEKNLSWFIESGKDSDGYIKKKLELGEENKSVVLSLIIESHPS